jgi:hypothetical protein
MTNDDLLINFWHLRKFEVACNLYDADGVLGIVARVMKWSVHAPYISTTSDFETVNLTTPRPHQTHLITILQRAIEKLLAFSKPQHLQQRTIKSYAAKFPEDAEVRSLEIQG